MHDLNFEGSRTMEDGTVVTVTSNPNHLIVVNPDGEQVSYSGEEFDATWPSYAKLFNTSEPATTGASHVDEEEQDGMATGPTDTEDKPSMP
jgi:hypothetical protein